MRVFSRERTLNLDDIVGLPEVKDVIINAVQSPNPVSVLLVGPPQSAKTMILERLAAHFDFNGGIPYTFDDRVTPVGLARLLFTYRDARAMVFDEIDKAKRAVLAVFNEAVESRRVTFINARIAGVIKLRPDVKFFCGCNSERLLELKASATLSRFLRVRIPAYERDMFVKVMVMLLTKKEYGGFSPGDAQRIAEHAWESGFRDIRQLRELGKIYPRRPDKVIGYIDYYRSVPKR
jgi:MoxR-like ATPase